MCCWRNPTGTWFDNPFAKSSLIPSQILANQVQIGIKLLSMLHPVFSNFLNKWIFHVWSPKNESGDTISGHSYPAFSTACLIITLVNGLLMCEKFHVAIKSIPPMAAMAMCNASSGYSLGTPLASIIDCASFSASGVVASTGNEAMISCLLCAITVSPRDASFVTSADMNGANSCLANSRQNDCVAC